MLEAKAQGYGSGVCAWLGGGHANRVFVGLKMPAEP